MTAIFDLHAKPEHQSERLVDSEQVMTRTFTEDKRHRLSSEHWKQKSIISSCVPPANTALHSGQIERLWEGNYDRRKFINSDLLPSDSEVGTG